MWPGPDQPAAEPLLAAAPVGRRFIGRRKVRLGDVDRSGRLRLDALTRYTQDVSDDDTTDAGLAPEPGWVVRSTVVDEVQPAELAETITCETFCSALGKRWAERRLSISGDRGARYEVATLWVCIDAEAGRPAMLTEQFLGLYGEAAAGRTVSAKLRNPKPSAVVGPGNGADDGTGGDAGGSGPVGRGLVIRAIWPLRAADYDIYDHVNNAAYWAVVEEWGAAAPWPRRMRLEYGQGVAPAGAVPLAIHQPGEDGEILIWWLDEPEGGADTGYGGHGDLNAPTLASASVGPLPSDLYDRNAD
ncbi:MAG: acyl-ACP thioesterase domain-containing protein [Actinomycetota bacterium]